MFDKTKIGLKKKLRPYYVEDWEQTIYIKKVTGTDMELLEEFTKKEISNVDGYILNIIIAVVDSNGNPIFNIEEDWDMLKAECVDVLSKIIKQIQIHNTTDEEELKKK